MAMEGLGWAGCARARARARCGWLLARSAGRRPRAGAAPQRERSARGRGGRTLRPCEIAGDREDRGDTFFAMGVQQDPGARGARVRAAARGVRRVGGRAARRRRRRRTRAGDGPRRRGVQPSARGVAAPAPGAPARAAHVAARRAEGARARAGAHQARAREPREAVALAGAARAQGPQGEAPQRTRADQGGLRRAAHARPRPLLEGNDRRKDRRKEAPEEAPKEATSSRTRLGKQDAPSERPSGRRKLGRNKARARTCDDKQQRPLQIARHQADGKAKNERPHCE